MSEWVSESVPTYPHARLTLENPSIHLAPLSKPHTHPHAPREDLNPYPHHLPPANALPIYHPPGIHSLLPYTLCTLFAVEFPPF